jgi:hypothetical protein
MKSYTIHEALLNLYSNSRKAPLPLDEHDNNRIYLDILAQALNLQLSWSTPTEASEEVSKPVSQQTLQEKQKKVQKALKSLEKKDNNT